MFSGFLSVDTYAYTSYDFFPATVDNDIQFSSTNVYHSTFNSSLNIFSYNNPDLTTDRFYSRFNDEPWSIAVNTDIYDYYFISSVYAPCSDISKFTYFPTTLCVYSYDHSNNSKELDISNINIYHLDTITYKGFSVSCKVDFSNDSNIGMIAYSTGFNFGTIPANLNIEYQVLALPKYLTNGDINAAVVAAINNQTSVLGGKLDSIDSSVDQAADDIQQSIEDQYSGEPEDEFAVDDVITQHNEKMGVLSFGSDVMLQFLDMFQSANVGTAELTLPGFNITVENVEYSVWPDYSFNFEQLNEWVPALMSVIRVMLPVFVWLMVLRYCIKVFEDNFLSK